MSIHLLYLFLTIALIRNVKSTNGNECCKVDKELEKVCESYTYFIVKPMLEHFQKINVELDKSESKDAEIKDLKEKLVREEDTVKELRAQINFHQKTIETQTLNLNTLNTSYFQTINEQLDKSKLKDAEIEGLKSQINTQNVSNFNKTVEIESLNVKIKNYAESINKTQLQLESSEIKLLNQNKELELCQIKVNESNEMIKKLTPPTSITSCDKYGVYKLKLSSTESFDVLCDSQTVGIGWIVIQQRIDGKEDFFRDWNTYRDGFGSFDGDFFLGLEKIHRLTFSQKCELYIYMEDFDGNINYVRYDNFKVAGASEGYKLICLGEFSSNGPEDQLRWHEKQRFTTFDRENDVWSEGNCAIEAHGGWWYNACAASNLNGKYSEVKQTGPTTVYWAHYMALQTVKMLIHPK